jgi:hypothetical protein
MRFCLTIFLGLAFVQGIRASAESENEPSAGQYDILSKAISASPIKSHYSDKEKIAYYLRDASFIARVKTIKGYLLVFRFTFIRSSPYREGAITPPRGHTFAIVFDDNFDSAWYREADMPDDLKLDGVKLSAEGQWAVVLPELTLKKTEQGAAANP